MSAQQRTNRKGAGRTRGGFINHMPPATMDFADQILALAARIPKQLDHIHTEEATKNALVLPFINALGYNVFDPTEVVPEFTADVGIKKGEKVDYAIKLDGKVIMLFECKQAGAALSRAHASQLFRYFTVTDARVGVLTNGIRYQFYSDLEQPNKMDERSFLEFDMLDLRESLIPEMKQLTKSAFNIDQLLSSAQELKYTRAIRGYLADQVSAPTDDFVRFLTKQVYGGAFTQAVKEQFAGIVRKALLQFINERIEGRLKSALREEEAAVTPPVEPISAAVDVGKPAEEIVTTNEEMEGFYIVRAILRDIVNVKRVAHRDVKTYFGVLLDDNNRKPLCRLHFNTGQKYIGLINDKKEEERIPIESLDDIYRHADRIRATVSFYEKPQGGAST